MNQSKGCLTYNALCRYSSKLVWDESEESVKKRFGNVRVELVNVLSCHPPLAEYRVWIMELSPASQNVGSFNEPNPAALHQHILTNEP